MRRLFFIVIAALSSLLLTAPINAEHSPNVSIVKMASSPAALRWADSVMNTLNEREKVAQLFIPHLVIKDDAAGRALLKKYVSQDKVGGILLGKGTVESYTSLIGNARGQATVPLMVTLDGEWGPAMRLTDVQRFPYNMALGAVSDYNLIERYGAAVARQCKSLGINVNFAPVADVNSNPQNPVIGYRSFGENPKRVSRAVTAYSKGLESGGVMAVAKHFPGHGDTSTDSHKTLPTVDHSVEQMDEVDLLPFEDFVKNGFGGVMVGHLRVPSLDKTGTPASLSYDITTHLLKDDMKFDGLVFTDALAMKGAGSQENNCVAALRAGADVLLGSASPSTDIDAVLKAVKNGKIKKHDIETRCRKVLAFKYALGLADPITNFTASQAKARISEARADDDLLSDLARGAIVAVKNLDKILPIRDLDKRKIAVVSIGAGADNKFSETCAEYTDVAKIATNDGSLTASQIAMLNKCDIVIAAVFSDSKMSQQTFRQLVTHRGLVGVFFMNPYKMAKFGGALHDLLALICAGDDLPEIRIAAANGIFGGERIDGRMPVGLNGICKEGEGTVVEKNRLDIGEVVADDPSFDGYLTQRIDSVMTEALRAGAFPGAQVLVGHKGNIVYRKNFGFTDSSKKHAVTDTTLYDLASVTKATATVSGLMKAYDEGLFDLNDPVSKFIPELRNTDKGKITFKQLLLHESGMPAGISTLNIATERTGNGKERRLRSDLVSTRRTDELNTPIGRGVYVGDVTYDTLMSRIHDVRLRNSTSYNYSDLNFCLLCEALENMTGVSLDQWVENEVFLPIGATRLLFCPLTQHELSTIAATENDETWRNQVVHGYVHDETAALSGGVQGNAGLFGTATDLGKLCQLFLNGGRYGNEQIIEKNTVKTFTTTSNSSKNRFLAFDRQPSGSPASVSTFGHNGFTGTCFWVDPDNELFIVFLSNRVNPSRNNKAFSSLKPRTGVIKAVYDSLK